MSLPKFNLNKLRESVSAQQAVTKKDIADLLLLDRLRAGISKQKKTEEIKKINFDYRVRVWYYDDDFRKLELLWYGPISNNVSFCKYLEDKIKKLKRDGKKAYFEEEFLDQIYDYGCDEFEDRITSELSQLEDYGEESDNFVDFIVQDKKDKEINISISVQRY